MLFVSVSVEFDYRTVLFQIARQSYLDYLKSISKTENTEINGAAYAVSEPGCSHANVRPQESSDDAIGIIF